MRASRRVTVAAVCMGLAGSCAAAPRSLPAFQRQAQAALGQRAGCALVMRVSDGRVLAMVNPSQCRTQRHPPGSIFKLVTAFAALQEQVASPLGRFHCGGQRKLSGTVLHCTIPNGHDSLTLTDAIAQSCNVRFYELGLRLGAERLLKYAHLFGFSIRSASRPVHPCDLARLAIGQAPGLTVTPFGAGEMVRRIVMGKLAVPAGQASRARANLSVIRRGMRAAVERGTCRRATVPRVAVAGKTGSTENAGNPDERSAWFVGFAPFERPEVIVVVFVSRGHGYDTAAPIAGRIFSGYFGREESR